MASMPTTTGAEPSSSSQYTYTASTASYFPTPFHLQQTPPVSYIGAAPPPAIQSVQLPVYPAPPSVYSLPQYQQAQQLFQRDAQTITPEALESVKAALASSEIEHKADTKKKAIPRKAAGQAWEDPTLAEWPENDYRLFCGDLGNEVNDDVLSKVFTRLPSLNMARVSFSAVLSCPFFVHNLMLLLLLLSRLVHEYCMLSSDVKLKCRALL
ncbi:uncharacterized protein [Primulina huaijiensis]|uniref:uncharacterized protein n=1 Tax=Primulina huaijiensis TaxID=1492673 RepID=UPI003CC79630